MNIIRTRAVELNEIPAIAYKQKLLSGGAGIKIFRIDREANAVFTIDKRSGAGIPYGPYDEKLFPDSAVDEAIEMTEGLPYSTRGKLRVTEADDAKSDRNESKQEEREDVTLEHKDAVDMVDSDEYKAFLERYCDEKGKMNYHLLNKDFIQFASRSSVVTKMISERALEEDILSFIVNSRATNLSGRKEALTKEETDGLIETLEEIDPRSAFKETKAYIRRLLAKNVGRQ